MRASAAQAFQEPPPSVTLNCDTPKNPKAFCFGISKYQDESEHLPQAANDAENMARVLHDLGCGPVATVTTKNKPECLKKEPFTQLISDAVHQTKERMKEAEANSTLLVVFYVAAHGIQPEDKELPLIVPADLTRESNAEEFIDLDLLLLKKLKSVRLQDTVTCGVVIIVDTCRELPIRRNVPGGGSASGSGTGSSLSRPQRPPDFLYLFACQRDGRAYDSNSLSSALMKSLQRNGISIKDACEQAGEAVRVASGGRQRPEILQAAVTTFSNMLLPRCEDLERGEGTLDTDSTILMVRSPSLTPVLQMFPNTGTARRRADTRGISLEKALVVLFVILLVLFCSKVEVAGDEDIELDELCPLCPSKSCLCTDCHHQHVDSKAGQNDTRFDCQNWNGWGTWNRISVAFWMHLGKVCGTMLVLPKLERRPNLLEFCAFIISVVNILTSINVLTSHQMYRLQVHARVIPSAYFIQNILYVVASMRILWLIDEQTARKHTTVLGIAGVLWLWLWKLVSAEDEGNWHLPFYSTRVFTGAMCAAVGFATSGRSESRVAKKTQSLFFCISQLVHCGAGQAPHEPLLRQAHGAILPIQCLLGKGL